MIPDGRSGAWSIRHVDGATRLYQGDDMVMNDDHTVRRLYQRVLGLLSGDVLMLGLGVGLVLHDLNGSYLSSMTVVENSPDVIALVAPHVACTVIETDAWIWTPADRTWDTILLDIWPEMHTPRQQADLAALRQKYSPYLRDARSRLISIWD